MLSFQLSSFLILLTLTVYGRNSLATRYSNDWSIVVSDKLTLSHIEDMAQRHGLRNRGQIGNLRNHYWLHFPGGNGSILQEKTRALQSEEHVLQVKQQELQVRVKKGYDGSDACLWPNQWSLKNTGQTNGPSGLDLNVEPVWIQGVTGKGVVVGVVDDGVDYSHPAIKPNYNSSASYDFMHYDSDPMPDPASSSDEPNSHGTSCTGEIAMTRNSKCGSGVAFESQFAALKINLVSDSTDAVEASALGHQSNIIQIYSNSWGPPDDGFEVDGPDELVNKALSTGVTKGRDGYGSIYVWAAGNGGTYFDSCAADGYASSIYTIAVGSANQDGQQADYDESCAGKMAVTFSYNSDTFPSYNDDWDTFQQVVTTDLDSTCTDGFTGTSASAPLVSAVIALALEVNPRLTWRDVQYLIAYTSNTSKLVGGTWTINNAGLSVSHEFGFGAIDAEALVTRARHWTTVPPQMVQTTNIRLFSGTALPNEPWYATLSVETDVVFVEHVVLNLNLSLEDYGRGYDLSDFYDAWDYYYNGLGFKKGVNEFADFDFYEFKEARSKNGRTIYDWLADPHPKRGDIQVELTSPQGTTSVMLPYRKYDFINEEGYSEWPFVSVHFWGENPNGNWTVKVLFKSSFGRVSAEVEFLTLYGTTTVPAAISNIPSQCDPSCIGGCAGSGSDMCDACVGVRDASTLQCATSCGNGNEEYDGYCVSSYSAGSPAISCYNYIIIPVVVVIGIMLVVLGIPLAFCIGCYCFRRCMSKRHPRRYAVNVDEEPSSLIDEPNDDDEET